MKGQFPHFLMVRHITAALCSYIMLQMNTVTFYEMSATQPSTTKCQHPQTETKSASLSHNTYSTKFITNHR